MKNIYIGFGSSIDDVRGGLERVSRSHFTVRSDKDAFYNYFILLGTVSRKNDNYIELPWREKKLLTKFISLIQIFFLLFKNKGRLFIHGSPLLSILGFIVRKRVVIVHHGDVYMEKLAENKKGNLGVFILFVLTCITDKLYTNHVTYNKSIESRLIKANKTPLIIPNFVENTFQFDIDNVICNIPTIAMLAYWNERKNLQKTIDFVKNKGLVRIIIIGRPTSTYLNEFNKILKKIEKLSNVKLEHYQDIQDNKINQLLSDSDYFLHMADEEGFPRAMQEAQICGCTVICKTLSFNPDLLINLAIDIKEISTFTKVEVDQRISLSNKYKKNYSLKAYTNAMSKI
jgi:glycosyltransferase involved in cell wall biosynthesis